MDGKPYKPDKPSGSTLKFVNIERPGDATNEQIRRQVRSHVSRLQHRQNRERYSRRGGHPISTVVASIEGPGSGSVDSSEDGQTAAAPATSKATTTSWIRHSTESDSTTDEAAEHPRVRSPENEVLALPAALTTPASPLEKAFSRGSLAFRTVSLNDPDNIIGKNISELGMDVSSIMSFYRMISIIQAQDFDQQYGAVVPGVTSWKRFYAFVWTDPVMLTMAILITARHQFEVLGREASGQDGVRIVNMERFLLQRINEALQDPIRGISDQLLVAVALYAAYEIKHGNGARYHIHMRGLVQMINLRGGLRELGQQDPYVNRLLLWQDANTAKLAGITGYLHEMDNGLGQSSSRPRPNPRMFQLR